MSSKTCFKSNHTNYVAGAIPPDMYQTCQPNMNGNQTYLSQLNCNYTTDFQKQFYETWSDYITNRIELKSDTEVKYKWFVHFKLHIKSFKDMGLSGSWFRCRCHNGPSRCTATVNNCLFPDDAYCYECTQFDRWGECCCECDACFQRQGHPHVSLRFNVKDIQYIIMWNSATTAWPTDGWPTIVISCYSMSIHDTSWVLRMYHEYPCWITSIYEASWVLMILIIYICIHESSRILMMNDEAMCVEVGVVCICNDLEGGVEGLWKLRPYLRVVASMC